MKRLSPYFFMNPNKVMPLRFVLTSLVSKLESNSLSLYFRLAGRPVALICGLVIALFHQAIHAQVATVSPGDNIQAVLDTPGITTVRFNGGLYRMTSTLFPKAGQTLEGINPVTDTNPAILSGAKVVTAAWNGTYWTIDGNSQGLTTLGLSTQPTPCVTIGPDRNPNEFVDAQGNGSCVYMDQVFLDDQSLWQVLSINGLTAPDRFYWDYNTNVIYLATNPTGRKLEVSVYGSFAISATTTVSNVTVRKLILEKFGRHSSLRLQGDEALVENNEMRLNNYAGIIVNGDYTIVRNNYVHHNTGKGISVSYKGSGSPRANGIEISGNELSYNNTAGYDVDWDASAIKCLHQDGMIFRGNWSHHNYGDGLWFDSNGNVVNILVENNTIEDNFGKGIHYETSHFATIRNNILRRNGTLATYSLTGGIFIATSEDVEVYGNLLEDNHAGITAISQNRSESIVLKNLNVHDNHVIQSAPNTIAAGLSDADPNWDAWAPSANNRWSNNTYCLENVPTGRHFQWPSGYMTQSQWVGAGQDTGSTFYSLANCPSVVPSTPTNLSATPGDTQIALAWTASSGATSYNVKRSTTAGGPYTVIATSVISTSYTNTGLTNGATYYYVVSAVNSGGESGNSNEASATPTASTGPLAWYRFEEGSGTTAADSSGNVHNGTINGATWVTGRVGGALDFNGTTAYVSLGNPAGLNITGQITLSAWIKPMATDGIRNIVAHGHSSSPNAEVQLRVNAGNYETGSWNGTAHKAVYAIPSGDVGTWVLLTGTYDGTTWRLYRNGVQVASTVDSTGALTVTENWAIGARGTGTERFFAGSIDEARIYNRALSAQEALQLFDDAALPAAPTNLTATGGDARVSLSWTAGAGAISYNVKRSTASGGPYSVIATGVATTSYTNTGLTNGTTYYYVVSSVNAVGEGANSNQASATPIPPPTAPTGLTATAGNTQVSLAWTASAFATSYNVKRATASGGPYTVIGITSSTTLTDTAVVNGTTYYYVVSASNAMGESANSNEASATPIAPPSAPTGLTATPGNTQVSLAWTASSGASSYSVKRSTTAGGPYTTIVTGITTTGYTNTGLTNGTTYYYVVSAVNAGGESGNSNEASATPVAPPSSPTNLNATPGDMQIALSWTASSGAASYNVKRSTTAGGPYTVIATGVTMINYTNTGLTNGTTYYYVVSAVNGGGESGNSNEASATPMAATGPVAWYGFDEGTGTTAGDSSGNGHNGTINGATWVTGRVGGALDFNGTSAYVSLGNPAGLNITGQITLSAWIKPTSIDTDGQRNIIAHGHASSPQAEVLLRVNRISGVSYYETGSWNGTSHKAVYAIPSGDVGTWVLLTGVYDGTTWRLYRNGAQVASTVDSTGALSVAENWAIGARGTGTERFFAGSIDDARIFNRALSAQEVQQLFDDAGVPVAPTNLTATAGNAQVALAWTMGAGAISYNVKRSTTAGGPYSVVATGVTTTSHTNTGLTNGTTYYFVVSAVNAMGESPNSNEAAATPFAPIGFRSATSANTGSATATSITVNKPSGVVSGDFMLAGISIGTTTAVIAAPSGWTHVRTLHDGVQMKIYRKLAGSSEPSNYTWSISNGETRKMAAGILAFTGVNTTTPIQVENGVTHTASASTTHTTPTIATTGSTTWLVSFFGDRNNTGSTWTPPSGATERVDTRSTGSNAVSISIHTQGPVTAGNKSHTATASVSSEYADMEIVALQPYPFQ